MVPHSSTHRRSRAMRRLLALSFLVAVAILLSGPVSSAQTVASLRLYEQHCTSCHGNPAGPKNAPDGAQLRKLSSDAIYDAIAKLPAHSNLQSVSDEDKRLT